jgi:hypothetical protein
MSDERSRTTPFADEVLRTLHDAGFVVVRATTLAGVLDEAEGAVRDACCVRDGKPHPALARRYERDMAEINELRKELAHAQQS